MIFAPSYLGDILSQHVVLPLERSSLLSRTPYVSAFLRQDADEPCLMRSQATGVDEIVQTEMRHEGIGRRGTQQSVTLKELRPLC
jgi:hypothetical protein